MKNKSALAALGPEIPRKMPDAPATGFTSWPRGAGGRCGVAWDSPVFVFTCRNHFIGQDMEIVLELTPSGMVRNASVWNGAGRGAMGVKIPAREVSGMLLDLAQTKVWEGMDLSNGLGELIAVCNGMKPGGQEG